MTAARSDLMALDPLEMLLDAARFADSIKPEWAKAARKAVAAARLAASQPDREAVAEALWRDEVSLIPAAKKARDHQLFADQHENTRAKFLRAADTAILSLLSGAGSGADTKSDGGRIYTIEHDGFVGSMQGSYITREGKRGVVLQQIGTRVVHVYGEKWLKTPDVKPAPIADSSEAGRGIDAAAKFFAEKVTGFQWDGIRNDGRSGDAGFPPFGHYTNARQEDYRDVVREIARLAALSAPVGEPVAWRLTWPDGRHSFYSTKPPNFYECKPLYAALTRPLGGFVQGSIARKQSTDQEGSSRTETVIREVRPSVPSDGFDCIYLYEDGREVGHLNGPQDDPAVIARAERWTSTSGGAVTHEY